MEVVGKQASLPHTSAWATPLSLSSDPHSTSHPVSNMQSNPNHHTSSSNASSTFPSVNPVDPFLSDPFRPSTTHLVRSESAPINILEEANLSRHHPNLPDLSGLSISGRRNSPLDSDLSHSSFPHPMNFAAAASSTVSGSSATSSTHTLGPLVQQGQRKPPQPTPGSNKPPPSQSPPSRSLSSVELANIVNGVATPGVSAVPAHMASNANVVSASASNSAGVSSNKAPVAGGESSGGQSKKSSVPAWHKSVFDMIQDDFPKTPSPMFSSLLASRAGGATQDGVRKPEPRVTGAERRSRLASTASLDLDLDRLGASSEQAPEVKPSRRAEDDVPASSQPPLRSHHRRSISINWTGDLSGLGTELSRSPSRTNLASSPPGASYFPSKRPDVPPFSSPPSTVVPPSQTVTGSSLPAAIGASGSTSPAQSLSPTGSIQRTAVPMSSPQASPLLPLASHGAAAMGPKLAQPTHANHYSMSGMAQDGIRTGVSEELGMPGLADYEYLYDHQDTSMVPSSTPNPNPLSVLPNQGYSGASQGYASSQANMSVAQSLGSAHGQSVGNGAQYANVFPGMGLFASPFSNNAAALGNGAGVAPVYNDSFRDGLAAAHDLKNMSIQMAAFLTAQQQLYAAQMAQMAAITGNSGFTGNPGVFGTGTIPGTHMAPVANTSHLRSPWDAREPNPSEHRSHVRPKHNFEQYRGSSSHVTSQKKSSGIDLGHKGRSGRGRRGYRAHDDVSVSSGHKTDRVGLGGSVGGGMQDGSHARSPLLEEFRATSLSIGRGIGSVADVGIGGGFGSGGVGHTVHGGREWQLSEIKDNVVEFATDQHGSRFIQQKLESASSQDKEAILKQALTDAQRLMTDVFGNYVVQKLLDHGGENAVKLIAAELEGRMLVLSLHMYGCRVVQKALEVLESGARAALVRELDGHVLKCIRDQNGNHVIQKCVELVEPEAVQFIVDAVQGQAVVLAGHSYGCRVVQRILEHGAPNQKAPIMVEIMSSIADLIKDQYGNYVIQHVVEHGTVEERAVIMNLVRGEVCQLSQHKFASNVVERCLQHGSMEERQVLIEILIVGEGAPNSSPLNHLVRDQFGNYVVQRVLDVARPPQRERVVTILKAQVPAIKKYSYGKHIIARLEEHHGGVSSSGYHHSPAVHPHSSNAHVLNRGERQIGPTMIRANVSQGIQRTHNEFMYYE